MGWGWGGASHRFSVVFLFLIFKHCVLQYDGIVSILGGLYVKKILLLLVFLKGLWRLSMVLNFVFLFSLFYSYFL